MGKFNREFLEQFQVEDAAKTCMKLADGGGVVVSWEQGLGKTVLAQLVAKALRARRVLFVVPQDIVPQWTRTAEEMFLTDLRPIAGLRQALRVRERLRKGQTGWYVTWYEALSQAGKIEEMLPVEWKAEVDAKGKHSATPFVRTGLRETTQLDGTCPRCGMTQSADKQVVDQHMRDLIETAGLDTTQRYLKEKHQKGIPKHGNARKVKWLFRTAPGQNGPRVVQATCTRCGYSHWARRLKPAYYWLRNVFDMIVVDEGTKIKNMDSQTSRAIQGMTARHRLLLTGTPIKNYVPDAFALMWWAMGDNSPRFPFSHDEGPAKFEKEFSVVEYVIDRKHGDKKLSRKVLPQVSNLIAFWRLVNGGCVRRTKANAGVRMVPVRWHDLRAPFGEAQARAYKLWLHHFAAWYIEKHPDHPICEHPKLIERSAGILGQFAKLQFMCTLPEAESDGWAQRNGITVSNYTPKNVAVIRQAAELVNQGRKVVIFSAVKEHSLWMAKVLNGLGYPALSVVEERTPRSHNTQHSGLSTQDSHIVTLGPQGRADLVRDFIHDGFPILCASIHAMNLGHNLDCASAVIINGLPWDFATFDQAIARVHRITSRRPVDIYIAQTVCREDTDDFRQGASLDQKMRRLVRDKGDSAAFALDGTLPEREEVTEDLQAFLECLVRDWHEPVNVFDENDLRMRLKEMAT